MLLVVSLYSLFATDVLKYADMLLKVRALKVRSPKESKLRIHSSGNIIHSLNTRFCINKFPN